MYIALSVPIGIMLNGLGIKSVVVLFYLCYLTVNLMIGMIVHAAGREKWDILYIFIADVIFVLLFRDMILTINIAAAFVASAIIAILNIRKIKRFGWAVAAAAEITAAHLIFDTTLPKYAAVCIVILTFYGIAILLKKDIRYYSAIPIIMCIVGFLAPVSEKPYKWDFVRKAIDGTGKLFGRLMDETIYFFDGFGSGNLGYTGYIGTGKISGRIERNVKEELKFEFSSKSLPVYLKGRSYLTFTDKGLTNPEIEENFNDWFAVYMNALYNAGVDYKESTYFSKMMIADVIYKYLRTEDVIRPQTVLNITYADKVPKKKKKGFGYRVRYLALDTASPYFVRVLNSVDKEAEPLSYKEMIDYVMSIYSIDFRTVMTEEQYNAAVAPKDMTAYLDTSMATDRMIELTNELTKDCGNDYEKALVIEDYLRHYEYSTDVDLTGYDNYLDTFLFDEGRGYCVHYAGAMVMMLRIAGVPAKYTVGYNHYETESSLVYSSEAHSWPEAYIDGFGWISFEPTAVFKTAADTTWGLGEDSSKNSSTSGSMPYDDEYWKRYVPQGNDQPIPIDVQIEQDRKEADFRTGTVLRFLGYIGVMAAALVIFILVIKLIGYIKYLRLSPEGKIKNNMVHIFDLIDGNKNVKKKNRSIFEYPELIKDGEMRDKLKELIDIYIRIRYRGDEAEPEVIHNSREMFKTVKRASKKVVRTD